MTATDPFNIVKELEKRRIQRELAIAQIMERKQLAFKLAEEREKLKWTASGGFVTCVLSVLSSYHHKNLIHLVPLFPIAAYVGYNVHFCYGNKIELLNKKTQELMENTEKAGIKSITAEDVQRRIVEAKAEKAENELFSF